MGGVCPWLPVQVLLFCYKNHYPANYLLLLAFTILQSFAIASICATYQASGDGAIVLHAFVLTTFIFLSLTVFTLQTRIDFTFMGAGLFSCLTILILWGIINAIFGWHTTWLYSLFGAILFCLFILYDTSQLIYTYGYDDYVIASIDLYLDFLNLFLYILSLLGKRND